MINNDMEVKFIKDVTSEGKRMVINIPKKHHKKIRLGQKMIIQDLDSKNLTKEELRELIR